MEKFSKIPTNEERRSKLKESINKAREAGMNITHYHDKRNQIENLRQKSIKEKLSDDETAMYKALKDEMLLAEVFVKTVVEYRYILELLDFPKEKVDRILNHENAHANMAEQMDSTDFAGFRVRFHKGENGEMLIAPSIKHVSIPSFSEKQRLEENLMVTEAPIEYGDKLSGGDNQAIEQIKNKLYKLEQ